MLTMVEESDVKVFHSIQALVHETCLALNDENWGGFLDLCDPETFRYEIVNYSPEIRRHQIWMDRGYAELKRLLELLPRHNSDHSQLARHVTVYKIKNTEEDDSYAAVSLLTVYRTQLDGVNSPIESGLTSLYAVGKYIDRVAVDARGVRLQKRTVCLDTRQLDIGSHYLF